MVEEEANKLNVRVWCKRTIWEAKEFISIFFFDTQILDENNKRRVNTWKKVSKTLYIGHAKALAAISEHEE